MDEIDRLRELILSETPASEALQARLSEFEDAVRAQERAETLAAIRGSMHTLRGLVGFLKQEVASCVGPLEHLCDQLDRETAGAVTHVHPPPRQP